MMAFFQIGVAAGAVALDILLDATAKKICDCLDVIDKTLVDGFSGRDIETEKFKRAIADVKRDRADSTDSLATTNRFLKVVNGDSNLPGIGTIGRLFQGGYQAEIEEANQSLSDLGAQLAAREAEVAAGAPTPALENGAATTPLADSPLAPAAATGQGLTELCEAFTTKLDELSVAIEELAARSAVAMEGISAGVDAVEGEALAAGAEMSGEAAGALDEAFSRMEQSAENTFARIAQSGLGASDQLRSAFASLDNVIGDSLGKFGQLFSQLFGGGPASVLGSILGFAGGGAVQPGAPILVGERGPEIFLPSGPGRVLNAHNTARATGGAGAGGQQIVVHQTNSFTTDVRNSVRAEVLNALPLATNIAVRQVSDMLRGIRR